MFSARLIIRNHETIKEVVCYFKHFPFKTYILVLLGNSICRVLKYKKERLCLINETKSKEGFLKNRIALENR